MMISSFDFIIFLNVFTATIFVSNAYIPDASLSVVSITTQSRRFRYLHQTSMSFCFKYSFIIITMFNIFFVKSSSLRYLLPMMQPEGRGVPVPNHPLSHTPIIRRYNNGLYKTIFFLNVVTSMDPP